MALVREVGRRRTRKFTRRARVTLTSRPMSPPARVQRLVRRLCGRLMRQSVSDQQPTQMILRSGHATKYVKSHATSKNQFENN